jgi:hypothetical protein
MSLQFMRWDLVLLALIVGVPYGLIALAGVRDWFKERAFRKMENAWHAAHPGVTRWEPPSDWWWQYKYQGIK